MTPPEPWSDPEARPGQVIGEKYRVERLIGSGGMGYVVAATHLELDEPVAIKLLFPHVIANADATGRFLREARVAVKIKSRHVVRTFDVGRLASGAPYIVMELLDGVDVGRAISERGPMPWRVAALHTLEACEALAEAHALGVVHRDIKPGNIFLVRQRDGSETAKVLDFGISKLTSTTGATPSFVATHTSVVMGSPLYMSPEHLASARNADARSDVWSLGATLYEMLSGRAPFDGDSLPSLCTAILTTEPGNLEAACPDAPPALLAAVLRCLRKQPTERFGSMLELAAALAPFAPRGEYLLQSIGQASGRSTASLSLDLQASAPALSVHEQSSVERSGVARWESTGRPDGTLEPAHIEGLPRASGKLRTALLVAVPLVLVATVAGVVLTQRGGGAATPAAEPAAPPPLEPTVAAAPAVPSAAGAEVLPVAPSASAAPPAADGSAVGTRPAGSPGARGTSPASRSTAPATPTSTTPAAPATTAAPASSRGRDLFGDRF